MHKKWKTGIVVMAILVITLVVTFQVMNKHEEPYLSFSVDDATDVLKEIQTNEYESIFDCWKLQELRQLHEQYGCSFRLYLFENLDEFNVSDMSDKYRKEFEENADWLKFGFHWVDEGFPEEEQYTEEEIEASYLRTKNAILTFAGEESLAEDLRIHCWYGSPAFLHFLKEQGITTLYYPDNDTIGYGFTEKDDRLIRKSADGKMTRKLRYLKTDIRLENCENIETALQQRQELQDHKIIIFTHSAYLPQTFQMFGEACEWAQSNGYQID